MLSGTGEVAPRLEHPERLQARTRTILRAAQLVPARALRAARRPEEAEQRRLADTLPGIDAILMPVSAQIAPRADDCDGLGAVRAFHRQGRLIPFTPPWNLVGWPAITLPAARDEHGVPIGIQLVAPPAAAARLLELAAQLESTRAPSRAT